MRQTLLIDCQDEPGLIAIVSSILFKFRCNIEANDEFVDKKSGHFMMRTEVVGVMDTQLLLNQLKEKLPENADIKLTTHNKKKLILFASKETHCLGDLLLRSYHEELNAEILAVISNSQEVKQLVERFDCPFYYVPSENLSREQHELKLMDIVNQYQADYLILAKYMRILTPLFVRKFKNKIINIHHSFLPAFIGANPYKRAFHRGVKIIGATAHFVTDDLDEGPIITQNIIPVNHTHSIQDMKNAGRDVERITLANAIELLIEDRIFISGNRTIIFE